MKKINKVAIILFVIGLFAGCKNIDSSTKTVEYYLHNDKERIETAKECNAKYEQIGETPNCINAQKAEWEKIKGKSNVNKNNNKTLLEGSK